MKRKFMYQIRFAVTEGPVYSALDAINSHLISACFWKLAFKYGARCNEETNLPFGIVAYHPIELRKMFSVSQKKLEFMLSQLSDYGLIDFFERIDAKKNGWNEQKVHELLATKNVISGKSSELFAIVRNFFQNTRVKHGTFYLISMPKCLEWYGTTCTKSLNSSPIITEHNKTKRTLNFSDDELKAPLVYLNKKTGKRYTMHESTRALIYAVLSHYTYEDCCRVIDKKYDDWLGNETMEDYIRPKTLFKFENFDNYANEGGINRREKADEILKLIDAKRGNEPL